MKLVRLKLRSTQLHDLIFNAGKAALEFYEDTGACHFCSQTPQAHEVHCPFYRLYVPPPGDTEPVLPEDPR